MNCKSGEREKVANKEKSREKEQAVEMGEIPELVPLLVLY